MTFDFSQKVLSLIVMGAYVFLVRTLHINFFLALLGLVFVGFVLFASRQKREINYKKSVLGQLFVNILSCFAIWLVSMGGIVAGGWFLMFTFPIFLVGFSSAILMFWLWIVGFKTIHNHPTYYNVSVVLNFLVWTVPVGYFVQQNWDPILAALVYEPPQSYPTTIVPESVGTVTPIDSESQE